MRGVLEQRARRLEALDLRVRGLSPVSILERGYAIVQDAAGAAIREAGQVRCGDALSVRLHKGRLGVRVEEACDGDAAPAT